MKSVVALSLAVLESVQAFQAPAAFHRTHAASHSPVEMMARGYSKKAESPISGIGVLPPLGVWDPLGFIGARGDKMRRYEIMEIKHGRAAMLGFLHVLVIEAGIRFPGYLSPSSGLKFSDVPAGCIDSLLALPTAGWLQIMLTTCMMETGQFLLDPQTLDGEVGNIGGKNWYRNPPGEAMGQKTFRLNVERQNGRAAMMGITGCLLHELLGVDALYPTGGMSGAAPPTIF